MGMFKNKKKVVGISGTTAAICCIQMKSLLETLIVVIWSAVGSGEIQAPSVLYFHTL